MSGKYVIIPVVCSLLELPCCLSQEGLNFGIQGSRKLFYGRRGGGGGVGVC